MDPEFARGWEGLAAVASVIESWGFIDRDYTALAQTSAERALKLDPSLSMPWAVLSQVKKRTWPVDYDKVQQHMEKAIATDPRNTSALLWRGINLIELGFFDRAIADFDLCLKLEPGYHNCRSHKMLALLARGDAPAAIAEFNLGVANGAFQSRAESLLPTLVQRGNETAALLLMASLEFPVALRPILLEALRHPEGKHPPAREVVAKYLSEPGNQALKNVGLTHFHLWFGDYDRVADVDDSLQAVIIAWDPYPASFRNSPQMKRRLVNEGVVAYWRKHGFPPQCRAVGANDFTCDASAAGATN
jgi:tetratricopeptide (TPR) repeat protein